MRYCTNLAQLPTRVENRDILLAGGYAIGSKLDNLDESFQRESRTNRASLKLTETTISDGLRKLASSKDIEAFHASSDRNLQGFSENILDALQSHAGRAHNTSSSDLKAFQSHFETYPLAVEKTTINEFQAQSKDTRNSCSSDFKSFQRVLEQSLEQHFRSHVTGISKSWTQASGPLSEKLNTMLDTKLETMPQRCWRCSKKSQPFSETAILVTSAQVSEIIQKSLEKHDESNAHSSLYDLVAELVGSSFMSKEAVYDSMSEMFRACRRQLSEEYRFIGTNGRRERHETELDHTPNRASDANPQPRKRARQISHSEGTAPIQTAASGLPSRSPVSRPSHQSTAGTREPLQESLLPVWKVLAIGFANNAKSKKKPSPKRNQVQKETKYQKETKSKKKQAHRC
jgi:hypothetical protein